jgi:Dolichyl-phosphate-mannose-protein mannosyltransferase
VALARNLVSRLKAGLHGIAVADLASLASMACLSVVMLATLSHYGLTYDEAPHIRYGERVLGFYRGEYPLPASVARSSYGPGFDLLAALLRRISPWDAFRTNHWLCVWVALAGLLGTWRLGRLVAGPLGGLVALLFLALTPVYYGHQFNNPKDIPFAAGYVWALYFIARLGCVLEDALVRGWRRSLGYWLRLAIALALGMLVRVGGAVLIAYLFGCVLVLVLDAWRTRGRAAARASLPLLPGALGSALGAWGLLILGWPRALKRPLDGPAAALETVTQFTSYDSPTLLAGQSLSSNDVPWNYLPSYFALQLPELISACAAGALLGVGWWSVQSLRKQSALPWQHGLLLLAVLLPPLYAIWKHSTLYNGLRHFLFLIPPLCVLAASGVAALWCRAARWHRHAVLPLALLLGAFTVDQIRAMWLLHPHEHVFFNRAAGGIAAAVGRYETEYYGSVYRELLTGLLERVWQERRDTFLDTTFRVSGCGSKLFFTQNLPFNFEFQPMRRAQRSDFYASYVRDGCLGRYRDRLKLTAVERSGALLAVARDVRVRVPRAAAAPAGAAR